MTRVNCIDVSELNDKMLLAEYREIGRISKLARLPKEGEQFPKRYTLGKGHVKFFYPLGGYLKNRFENEIVPEMQKRGFATNFTVYRAHPPGLNKQWWPDDDARLINRMRIAERLGVPTGDIVSEDIAERQRLSDD